MEFAEYYTTTTTTSSSFSPVLMLVYLALAVVYLVAGWKVYTKANKPGWAIIIPIYNIYVLLKIVGRPGWWLLLFLVPFVNFVVGIVVAIDLAKSFGKSAAFGVIGLFFFGFIGYLMLGFGDATYKGPSVSGGPATPATPAPQAPVAA